MSIVISKTNQYYCNQCGAEIIRPPSNIRGKRIFCNRSCASIFYNKEKIIIKECPECHKSFRPTRGARGIFCSQFCASTSRKTEVYEKIKEGHVDGHSAKTMRNFLISTRGRKCEICNITEWMKQPLVVIMDHINGNSQDWSLSNLRLICSNCDTLTPTYKSKNNGNGRYNRRLRYSQGKSF